jgi:endoglucanase
MGAPDMAERTHVRLGIVWGRLPDVEKPTGLGMPRSPLRLPLLFLVSALTLSASLDLRWNRAGYAPAAPKRVVLCASTDLAGTAWSARYEGAAAPALEGRVEPSQVGVGDHTYAPFNHVIDLSALSLPGAVELTVAGERATLLIREDPYEAWRLRPLDHLRMLRSGSADVPGRRPSHLQDARARVYRPSGDPALGRWEPDPSGATVDALGGWYDAGDQIKFTLNHAYVVYHLLLAWDLATARGAGAEADRLWEEIAHGLAYLSKLHPAPDTFIIQVGDALDHAQGPRLPEDDPLDGKRPALCALSRVHLASTAAALARGARALKLQGRHAESARLGTLAAGMLDRGLKPDAIETAFERDKVNDFYRDPEATDQVRLAAAELLALTGDGRFARIAEAHAPGPANEVSWLSWNWLANAALADASPAARDDWAREVEGYRKRAAEAAPWGIPGRYVWGSLHRWMGAANATAWPVPGVVSSPAQTRVLQNTVDLLFGTNAWGVSFLFASDLPNTVRNLYGPLYSLLGRFPEGAISEGPGDRKTHASLERFFRTSPDDPLHRFNTRAAVFFDSSRDFMCQEATMGGQADALLLLALARYHERPPTQ